MARIDATGVCHRHKAAGERRRHPGRTHPQDRLRVGQGGNLRVQFLLSGCVEQDDVLDAGRDEFCKGRLARRMDGVPAIHAVGDGDAVHALNASDGRASGRGKGGREHERLASTGFEACLQLSGDVPAQRGVHRLVEHIVAGKPGGHVGNARGSLQTAGRSRAAIDRDDGAHLARRPASADDSCPAPRDERGGPVRRAGQVVGDDGDTVAGFGAHASIVERRPPAEKR